MALATEKESGSPTGKAPSPVKIKSEPAGDADDNLRQLLERSASAEGSNKSLAAAPPPLQVAPLPAPTRLAGGQRTIRSYFEAAKSRDAAAAAAQKQKLQEEEEEKQRKTPVIDLESIRGIFGWCTLEGVHIPFILRQEDKFTAVRIIEKSLLKKYLQALPTDVYSCTYIKSYFITDNEARLLNEINMKHCDRQFGHDLFTTKDLVVQLSDVEQLYEFLATCYYKLLRPSQGHKKEARCGLVRVDDAALVPYVRRNGTKYVPLALLDRHATKKLLEINTDKLQPWEVSYVKFCCKVAGIGNEFLKQDSCPVVAVEDVRRNAGDPTTTTTTTTTRFDEWWPPAYAGLSSASRAPSGPAAWSTGDARDSDVGKDENGFESPYHLPPPPASPAAATFLDEGIAPALHGLYACANADRELVAAPLLPIVASPRAVLTSELPADGCGGGVKAIENGLADARLSYPIPFPLSSAAMASPNPQAFIYNHGQWWGSLGSRSFDGRYCPPGIAHCQSLAAHCPQGPTQCSPGTARPMPRTSLAYPSSVLGGGPAGASRHLSCYASSVDPANGDAESSHSSGLRGDRASEKRHSSDARASGRSSQEEGPRLHSNHSQVPSFLRINLSDPANRKSSPGVDGQFHNVLPKTLPPPLVPDGDNLLRISNVASLVSANAHRGGGISSGLPVTIGNLPANDQSPGLLRHSGSPSSSFLASHLLSSSERHHGHHLEKNVVAPGNVQSLAGKMSSPKPGNQVPTTVTGEVVHRQPLARVDGITRMVPNLVPPPAHLSGFVAPLLNLPNGQVLFNSKLQELLNHSEASLRKTPSSRSASTVNLSSGPQQQRLPHYKLQSVLLSGTKFRAINSVEYEYHSGLMVPIVELSVKMKPRASTQTLKHILSDVFGLRLFECNRSQEELLKSHLESFSGSCRTTLICIEDLMKYLPQLSYAVTKLRTQENEPVAKRARVETIVSS